MSSTASLPILLTGDHWRITAITLYANTDIRDTLVRRQDHRLYRGGVTEPIEGSIFFLEDDLHGGAYVILADCTDYEQARLTVADGAVTVSAGTSRVTMIFCRRGECERACREEYRRGMKSRPLVTMSNTWGDGNRFTRVCEDFVRREIDKAAALGIDIVQIDDGWQYGGTADPARRDKDGRRVFADDFWQINRERFPSGIAPLASYAAERGIRLGLWFAPESRDHFACLERDLAILKTAYDEWGVRFFKLDMYRIEDDLARDRFLAFLEAIAAFGDDVSVQLDVTTGARINYLCGREHGTVFVENRYTKSGCYFPHRTLRNLWELAHYIPAARLQFELLNPALNTDRYDGSDALAPVHYGIDYLFASVMVSNPLLWMEMQFLSPIDSRRLQGAIAFFRANREIFSYGDVAPIGDMPCGRSFTGFHITYKGEEYALILREASASSHAAIPLDTAATHAVAIFSGTVATATVANGVLNVMLEDPRSYTLFRLTK